MDFIFLKPIVVIPIVALIVWIFNTIRYELTDTHLVVYLAGIPVRRIAYPNIESIRLGHALWGENYHSHWNAMWTGKALTIRSRAGFLRNINLSADHPQDFIQQIESKRRALAGAALANSDAQDSTLLPIVVGGVVVITLFLAYFIDVVIFL
jgi:hypothetical protein